MKLNPMSQEMWLKYDVEKPSDEYKKAGCKEMKDRQDGQSN